VSELPHSAPPQDPRPSAGEEEEVDALPVLSGEPRALHAHARAGALPEDWRGAGTVIPAVQAAAVAAGGFVAGAAVVGLVHRRHQRSAALAGRRRAGRAGNRRRRRRSAGRAGDLVQIVGSRSFLVDVHLLGGSGENR
jgi:hypothetical protein